MNKPVIVVGGGGHARTMMDILQISNISILGYTDPDPKETSILNVPHLGDDREIFHYDKNEILLVNGIGFVPHHDRLRKRIYDRFVQEGYAFSRVIHPFSYVSTNATLSDDVQLMAGAVVQPGSSVGKNTIINTRSSVDHDCLIGDHVHIAPGVTICGSVKIGNHSFVGAGATIIQGVTVGEQCVIGAGAVVVHDVPDGKKVMGIPAKEV